MKRSIYALFAALAFALLFTAPASARGREDNQYKQPESMHVSTRGKAPASADQTVGTCQPKRGKQCQLPSAEANTLTVRAKKVHHELSVATWLPPTKQGRCFMGGLANGMGPQGAVEASFVYCELDESGRPVYDGYGNRAWHVTTMTAQIDSNAWMDLAGSVLNGAVGSIASAAIYAGADTGGGGAVAIANNVANSAASVKVKKSAGGGYTPPPARINNGKGL